MAQRILGVGDRCQRPGNGHDALAFAFPRPALTHGWVVPDRLFFLLFFCGVPLLGHLERAGGRSGRTIDDYRKKLELFQRWVAGRYGVSRETEEVDAPYLYIGADEIESYVISLRDERGMADSPGRITSLC